MHGIGDKMKGFFVSLVTITMILILFFLWSSTTRASIDFDLNIYESYSSATPGFLVDDIWFDVNKIVGPSMNITEGVEDDFTRIYIGDSLPKSNFTARLQSYKDFVEERMLNQTNANISLDFSSLTDGELEVATMDSYAYINNYSSSEENTVFFYKNENDTGVYEYYINITTSEFRESVNNFNWNPSGSINVTLVYTDNNGTTTTSGRLRPNIANEFEIEYENGGEIEITIGRNFNDGEFVMRTQNVSTTFNLVAVLDPQSDLVIGYYATLNYTSQNVRRDSFIARES